MDTYIICAKEHKVSKQHVYATITIRTILQRTFDTCTSSFRRNSLSNCRTCELVPGIYSYVQQYTWYYYCCVCMYMYTSIHDCGTKCYCTFLLYVYMYVYAQESTTHSAHWYKIWAKPSRTHRRLWALKIKRPDIRVRLIWQKGKDTYRMPILSA